MCVGCVRRQYVYVCGWFHLSLHLCLSVCLSLYFCVSLCPCALCHSVIVCVCVCVCVCVQAHEGVLVVTCEDALRCGCGVGVECEDALQA